ncbi:MAG: bifunctional (p)ppGpp synthetase/guanosine-3',5'-bis(diphosphate) 3'-pyrophosphohydrolase [Alphaproteobacteria bacterium]|nr:bifunctional (p)ppGpp synthetase/guanosine-3',5'-bis(diphosphate) 3'-pyrophosphohydrolase [Alphaproteobacteria bacterium]
MAYNHLKALQLWKNFQQKYAGQITPDILKAGEFAIEAHKGQVRKNEDIPYVKHLFDVAGILIDNGQSENLIIAGLLHDVMEDTDKTDKDILALFSPLQGEAILKIILADTETEKGAPWLVRKQTTIDFAAQTDHTEGLLLICADKIANLGSLCKALEETGESTWNCFNSSKEQQLWYYETLCGILSERLFNFPKMTSEYKRLLEKVK